MSDFGQAYQAWRNYQGKERTHAVTTVLHFDN